MKIDNEYFFIWINKDDFIFNFKHVMTLNLWGWYQAFHFKIRYVVNIYCSKNRPSLSVYIFRWHLFSICKSIKLR
jgi:hypothetical protein